MDKITPEQISAFMDGELPDADMAQVAAYLEAHPEVAADLAGWQDDQAALRAALGVHAHGGVADLPVARLPRSRLSGWQVAAAAGLFVLGGLVGLVAGRVLPVAPVGDAGMMLAHFAEEAGTAHLIYAAEVRHPVEVAASEEAHLVAWLSKRLDTALSVPRLDALGYHLVGGRLLPLSEGAGALLMYEDEAGERLTLVAGRAGAGTDTAFRFAAEGEVRTFYWVDGVLGYALSGAIARDRLLAVAETVYAQL